MRIEYPLEQIGEGYITKYWLDNVRHLELPINKDLVERKAIHGCKYKVFIQLIEERLDK